MTKRRVMKEFYFGSPDIVQEMNEQLPIGLKYMENLIERVHLRYPLIDKTEIVLIIKTTYETMRELLALGCCLNFNKLFFDTWLFFYLKKHRPCVRVKITTPPPMKDSK